MQVHSRALAKLADIRSYHSVRCSKAYPCTNVVNGVSLTMFQGFEARVAGMVTRLKEDIGESTEPELRRQVLHRWLRALLF
jgi:hypothetical protein